MFNKKEYNKQYWAKNKEKILVQHKKWIVANKEHFDQYSKKWQKQYYAKNKGKINAKNKLYAQTHRVEMVKNVQRYVRKNKEKVTTYNKRFSQTIEGHYRTTKGNAKAREYDFQLSLKEYAEIISKPCFYCGELQKIGSDRVDNSIGYTKENSVPCCSMCNYMKKNYSKTEFLSRIQKIYLHNHSL